jgi:hypothetical protein
MTAKEIADLTENYKQLSIEFRGIFQASEFHKFIEFPA